jgi:hypothetical protein
VWELPIENKSDFLYIKQTKITLKKNSKRITLIFFEIKSYFLKLKQTLIISNV